MAGVFGTACRYAHGLDRQPPVLEPWAPRREAVAVRSRPSSQRPQPRRTARARAGKAGQTLQSCHAFSECNGRTNALSRTTRGKPLYSTTLRRVAEQSETWNKSIARKVVYR